MSDQKPAGIIIAETTTKLRRLHAEHKAAVRAVAEHEPVDEIVPDGLAAEYERTREALCSVVYVDLLNILHALDTALTEAQTSAFEIAKLQWALRRLEAANEAACAVLPPGWEPPQPFRRVEPAPASRREE